ncbi:MAG: methionyl-tRNA formyltransferase [Actinobacteria bacterium]|nr:methionyl-tRNA formyltransferase [Actinomycetota bacterium]
MPAPAPAHPRRLVYFGTPAMAVPTLRALVAADYDVALAVTRADKKRGRGGALRPSPVKAAALDLGIPVTTDIDAALGVGADAAIVVAFGRIFAPHVLDALPMLNMHFSLLPRWRGAAPVERAILAGDAATGVDIMVVDEALDEGAVYASEALTIGPDETADELRRRLVDAGTQLLLRLLENGIPEPVPQRGEPTYADKIDPSELELDWTKPALDLHRLVRIGGAWTTIHGQRLKIWRARLDPATSDLAPGELEAKTLLAGTGGGGALALIEVQPEGRGRQDAKAWRNGAHLVPGDRLGAP